MIATTRSLWVVRDRRYSVSGTKGKAWRVVAETDWAIVIPQTSIPDVLIRHWRAGKGGFGYAPARGLTPAQLGFIDGLIKGQRARSGINRWGERHCYKLLGVTR